MSFSLSLSGKGIRRTVLFFFFFSGILPILLALTIVLYKILPVLNENQIAQLKDAFSYGLVILFLIPGMGYFLIRRWIGSLEKFLEEIISETEKSLQANREGYHSLLTNIPIGLYRTRFDSQGQFLMANPAIVNMFGYDSVDEFLKIGVADLYLDPNRLKEFSRELFDQHETIYEELPLKKKDGTVIWGAITLKIFRDEKGRIEYLDGIIEDITQWKKVDEALKKSEKAHRSFAQIGMALSAEKDTNKLLEMIVQSARELSRADAGTLYIYDEEEKCLRFEILQNDSLNLKIGGTSGQKATLPHVPLYLEGKPNYSNVSSFVALTEQTINIENVYEVERFDFSGPKNYDKETGYHSKSMLVVPMKDHENRIIGVLQLLNALDQKSGNPIAFSDENVDLIASLASQAAVALTKTKLIHDLDALLNAFIKIIATAIDEKSPYTGGHINRVVELTNLIAEKINESEKGPFKDIRFSPDELAELRMAAWMHDVGKIVTPEHVVDKATKLSCVFDRIELVRLRFGLIEKLKELDLLKMELDLFKEGKKDRGFFESLQQDLENEKNKLQEDLDFLIGINATGDFLGNDKFERIKLMGGKQFILNGQKFPYLTPDEIENLTIRKGTLTEAERLIIEDHARITSKLLSQLPFPKKLAGVPRYAGEHHEKLDGSGYHRKIEGKDLSIQSRIIAFADIFEALTAKDRPYRKPMKLSQAIKIMTFMKKDRHIDGEIFDLFIKENLVLTYAEKEMSSEQIDQFNLEID